LKERKEKPEKIRSSPRKNPGFSGSVPLDGQFYVIQRTKISQKRPFLSQPKDKNFARKANFMPSERQKFPEKGHFLPTGEQEFPKNGQFYASRRTKISRKRPVL
jgi:hypothetical protein